MAPLAVGTLLTAAAQAQAVDLCDTPLAQARFVDWEDPTRTFANGQVRLVGLVAGEPSADRYILVLFPGAEGPGLDCRLISAGDGLGFASLSLRRASARYDSLRGLEIGVPGTDAQGMPLLVEFTLNRATGEVTVP